MTDNGAGYVSRLFGKACRMLCQSASNVDPRSASNFDPQGRLTR
jgi:hypothetical protein